FIYSKGDQPRQKTVEKAIIASSSITYVVDQLEKKQLLKRKPCPKDQRVIHATLTTEGTELMNQVFPEHKKAMKEIFSVLDVKEKQEVIEQLKKVGFHAQNL